MICRKCKKERRSFSVMHSKGPEPKPVGVCDYCFGIKKRRIPFLYISYFENNLSLSSTPQAACNPQMKTKLLWEDNV